MKSMAELAEIRKKMQSQLSNRDTAASEDIRIVVGMATCGIAAGARPVLNALNEEVAKRGLKNVKVTQTGCIGMCRFEPIVEVMVPGKPKVTYILVNTEKVGRIVGEHIVNGNVIDDYVLSQPAEDKK